MRFGQAEEPFSRFAVAFAIAAPIAYWCFVVLPMPMGPDISQS